MRDLVITPDDANLYLGTSAPGGGVFGFNRTAGNLLLNPSGFGCATIAAADGCASLRAGTPIQALAASSNSRYIYATGGNGLFTFALDRPPACSAVSAAAGHEGATAVQFSCTDPDEDPLSYEIVSGPTKGSLGSVQGDSVAYEPLPDAGGTDSFTYRAVGGGTGSDPATVTLAVEAPAVQPPVVQPPAVQPPTAVPVDNAACDTATQKLKKAKQKLKKLKGDDAKPGAIEKAKDKVAKLKKKVKQAC